MLNAGKAVKVSIYLSEGSKHHGVPTYSSILDSFFYRGVSGATVLKGVAGFWRGSPYAFGEHCRDLRPSPLKIEFVESREKVTELLGKAGGTCRNWNDRDSGDHCCKTRAGLEAKEAGPPEHVKIEGRPR